MERSESVEGYLTLRPCHGTSVLTSSMDRKNCLLLLNRKLLSQPEFLQFTDFSDNSDGFNRNERCYCHRISTIIPRKPMRQSLLVNVVELGVFRVDILQYAGAITMGFLL